MLSNANLDRMDQKNTRREDKEKKMTDREQYTPGSGQRSARYERTGTKR